MVSDLYKSILDNLVCIQGLETRGFRRAMRTLVEQFIAFYEEDEEQIDIDGTLILQDMKKEIDCEMGEWFGDFNVKPAAFRIVETDSLSRPVVHIYEIALGRRIPNWKLEQYGRFADADPGIDLTLHIVGETGNEIVLTRDVVMSFAFGYSDPYEIIRKVVADDPDRIFAITTRPSMADCPLPAGYQPTEKQKRDAAWRALRDLGITL